MKKLLKERFQELAGIKSLDEINPERALGTVQKSYDEPQGDVYSTKLQRLNVLEKLWDQEFPGVIGTNIVDGALKIVDGKILSTRETSYGDQEPHEPKLSFSLDLEINMEKIGSIFGYLGIGRKPRKRPVDYSFSARAKNRPDVDDYKGGTEEQTMFQNALTYDASTDKFTLDAGLFAGYDNEGELNHYLDNEVQREDIMLLQRLVRLVNPESRFATSPPSKGTAEDYGFSFLGEQLRESTLKLKKQIFKLIKEEINKRKKK